MFGCMSDHGSNKKNDNHGKIERQESMEGSPHQQEFNKGNTSRQFPENLSVPQPLGKNKNKA